MSPTPDLDRCFAGFFSSLFLLDCFCTAFAGLGLSRLSATISTTELFASKTQRNCSQRGNSATVSYQCLSHRRCFSLSLFCSLCKFFLVIKKLSGCNLLTFEIFGDLFWCYHQYDTGSIGLVKLFFLSCLTQPGRGVRLPNSIFNENGVTCLKSHRLNCGSLL